MASDDKQSLNRKERAALSPAERQSIIKNLFVEHDRFKDAITAVGNFHMPVEGGDPDFGVLTTLCGDTRTGKTFALERYAKRFPLSNGIRGDGSRGVIRRVVYADMPIDCNLRAMAEQIADALNLSHSLRMNTRGLVGAVLLELKTQAVEFLILDEFQEAFDVNRKKTLKDARGFLRKILNLRSLNVCVGGLVQTYELLAADKQLKGRGLLPHHLLQAYEWHDPVDQKLFRLLCASIDDRLPFREESKLGSSWIAQRLYWVTDGVIGLLKEFVFAAACRAMNADADCIEMQLLADAWDVRKPIGQAFNPFVDDLKDAPSREEKTPPQPPRDKFDDGIFSRK
jgi:hypothetical protein